MIEDFGQNKWFQRLLKRRNYSQAVQRNYRGNLQIKK